MPVSIALVKWRNQILALCCLLAFAGFGVLYFRHWVIQKPFGIVLFVGEGLTPARLAAARLYLGGADARLSIDSMSHVALLRNHSLDFAVPDQAAAATALATGTQVNNRAIGVAPDGKLLATIVELAHRQGRATGLLTNGRLTDPTAAAFFAHAADERDTAPIARQLLESGAVDVALGGGAADFLPQTKGGRRRDGRDLLLEARRDGYDVVRSRGELEALPAWRRAKVLGLFGDEEMRSSKDISPGAEQPGLSDMVRRGIELLQFNTAGYLLVVDAALARKAAQGNDVEKALVETIELDRAVATARRYVGRKSTIVVAGDCGVGGLNLSGFPYRKDSGIALLGLNSSGDPWFTWATGPNGTRRYGRAKLAAPSDTSDYPQQDEPQEPAAVYSQAGLNTAEDPLAAAIGPKSEALHGFMNNTAIFELLRDCL